MYQAKGFNPKDESSNELLKKHNIIPNIEYLDTKKYVNITDGRVLRQINITSPKGFKE